ncbi:hypothetical protein PQQ63_35985, partial [Paraburkholderia metrosideri]
KAVILSASHYALAGKVHQETWAPLGYGESHRFCLGEIPIKRECENTAIGFKKCVSARAAPPEV